MRIPTAFLLIAALASSAPAQAQAQAAQAEADVVRALEFCLTAVESGRPPAAPSAGTAMLSVQPDGKACTFAMTRGDPERLHAAVVSAIQAPPRAFTPAKTTWDTGAFTMRSTLCGPSGPRHFNLVISAGPQVAGRPQLIATVLESARRDPRCDRDFGVQPALSETLRR